MVLGFRICYVKGSGHLRYMDIKFLELLGGCRVAQAVGLLGSSAWFSSQSWSGGVSGLRFRAQDLRFRFQFCGQRFGGSRVQPK